MSTGRKNVPAPEIQNMTVDCQSNNKIFMPRQNAALA